MVHKIKMKTHSPTFETSEEVLIFDLSKRREQTSKIECKMVKTCNHIASNVWESVEGSYGLNKKYKQACGVYLQVPQMMRSGMLLISRKEQGFPYKAVGQTCRMVSCDWKLMRFLHTQ